MSASYANNKKPSHIAYYVRRGRNGSKNAWVRCGEAWQHQDARGFHIKLSSTPRSGVIELRANGLQTTRAIDELWAQLTSPEEERAFLAREAAEDERTLTEEAD